MAAPDTPPGGGRKTLVLAGYGMVGHRLVASLAERGQLGDDGPWQAVVVGEEPYAAYDRVALSSYVDGLGADDLSLVAPGLHETPGLTVHLSDTVTAIDPAARSVATAGGRTLGYDALVLATGSVPFVPPISGTDAPGVFVYRTIEDLDAIRTWAAGCRTGVVVGGGLLGLEAANALRILGVRPTVVEFAPRLMPVQLDEGAAAVLRDRIEALDITVHTGCAATAVREEGGQVVALDIDGWDQPLEADLVVFAAGVRPRDQLARAAGIAVGERGGVVIDDGCATSAPGVYAVGECAVHRGRVYGLVAPGYSMADVLADRLSGGEATFTGADTSTKLKLLGVDVASVGDAHGTATPGSRALVYSDPLAGDYRKLVVTADGSRVVGGILVGDLSAYPMLVQLARGAIDTPERIDALIAPASAAGGDGLPGVAGLPEAAVVCSCNSVDIGTLRGAIQGGADDIGAVKACTKAGTTCGSCVPLLADLLDDEHRKAGKDVRRTLCEHFDHTRQELFDIVRLTRVRSFSTLLGEHGRGRGCEICKPAVASMFASLAGGYILDGEQATLQDTNDHFLANMQRDGTYSVVPRVPGGEITPEKLIVLGQVAQDFDLYTKITGGQRIDLFGARVDQLPAIWARLVEAGFESGHAYGKALRTVKSCVGTTWCRYGVQDAVGLAIDARAPLPGAAGTAQDQVRGVGVRPRVRRGPGQGRRGDRHRAGLEPARRRQRRHDAPARRAARQRPRYRDAGALHRPLPHVLRPHRRPARADRHVVQQAGGWHRPRAGRRHRRLAGPRGRIGSRHGAPRRHLRVRVEGHGGRPGAAGAVPVVRERRRARSVARVRAGARSAAPRPATRARRPRRAAMTSGRIETESDAGAALAAEAWVDVVALDELTPGRGVAALVGGRQVAIFLVASGELFAVDNHDPFSETYVLSRGLVGDRDGVPKVASPMYKQSFDLRTGRCLDDDSVRIPVYPVRVESGRVQVTAQPASGP